MIYIETEDGVEFKIPVKAGTEELDFYSETDTYNRDSIPCIDFIVSEDLKAKINTLLEKIHSFYSESNNIKINIKAKDCSTCEYRNVSQYVSPCYYCYLTDDCSEWKYKRWDDNNEIKEGD